MDKEDKKLVKVVVLIAITVFILGTIYSYGKWGRADVDHIELLTKKVKCLEQGRIYAFDNYCMENDK